MGNIENWLEQYKKYWESKNVEGVIGLFAPDVVYGSHFKTHSNLNSIEDEWQSILKQRDIKLKFDVYASEGDKHAVVWDLEYLNQEDKSIHLKGTYLIKLDSKGKCTYFVHSGE